MTSKSSSHPPTPLIYSYPSGFTSPTRSLRPTLLRIPVHNTDAALGHDIAIEEPELYRLSSSSSSVYSASPEPEDSPLVPERSNHHPLRHQLASKLKNCDTGYPGNPIEPQLSHTVRRKGRREVLGSLNSQHSNYRFNESLPPSSLWHIGNAMEMALQDSPQSVRSTGIRRKSMLPVSTRIKYGTSNDCIRGNISADHGDDRSVKAEDLSPCVARDPGHRKTEMDYPAGVVASPLTKRPG